MIHGNTDGIRNTVLELLEGVYNIKSMKYEIAPREIIEIISEVTERTGREVSVVIDRRGNVTEAVIGDSSSVSLPLIDAGEKKLSGKRIIHTHPSGVSRLSALDISALLKLKLDAIAAVSVNQGEERKVTIGFTTVMNDMISAETTGELTVDEALSVNIADRVKYNEELIRDSSAGESTEETALLVGIESEKSLEELKELAKAAGINVSQSVLQKKDHPDNAYYLGSGKLDELSALCQLTGSDVIIADDELSGIQIKNMEDMTGVKVIDRTTLILEIFSRRARSRESKLQIELAQLKYRMNRLMGMGAVMSRTGGGIGTRGPGETKLETDRRKIRERFHDLSEELKGITKIRATQRENRHRNELPQVAIVGYTNSGKSTLRNKLAEISPRDTVAKEKVFEADMLFATLDTTTRAIELPDKRVIALTDTVGFIRKLPHDLVEAFKSTLEEVIYADILIHVCDITSPEITDQVLAVEEVLGSLGAVNKPMTVALNKADMPAFEGVEEVLEYYKVKAPVIEISALTGLNLDKLLGEVIKLLPDDYKEHTFLIPYSEGQLVSLIHGNGNVLEEEYREEGTFIRALVRDSLLGRFKEYETGEETP